jgi:20S proteasome alpha/beta subunit
MAKKLMKVGIKREKGYLYYVDKNGDISSAKMARGGKKGGSPKKVAKVGIKRETGFLYFVDKDGDVSSAKMVRGGAKKKAAKKKATKK